MTIASTEIPVGQLVAERPARAKVFERYKLDYCCAGKLTLAAACARKGLDPATADDWQPLAFLRMPIARMEGEHEDSGRDLAAIRERMAGFEPPAGACNSYRAMLAGLEELEADTHAPIHLENNLLFPRALARLAELGRA